MGSFFNDINLNNEDRIYLICLLAFSLFLAFEIIHFNQLRGAFNSDIYIYLINSLNFAGINYNNLSDPSFIANGPVICFLTSLLFRLGYVDINAIFIVTGFFSILGIFAMYAFLKVRFSSLLSFTGAILYSSLSITLYWFSNGMLDIPAVSMILWTLVFTVAAVDRNPKYYILVVISFVISFFIRFTCAYFILVLLLYPFKKFDIIDMADSFISDRTSFKGRLSSFIRGIDFRWMIYSSILGILLLLFGFFAIWSYTGQLPYINWAYSSISGFKSHIYDPNYITDRWFYFKNFLNFLSSNHITFNNRLTEFFEEPSLFAYLICVILACGILLKSVNTIVNAKRIHFRNSYKTKYFNYILLVILAVLLIVSRYGFRYDYLISLLGLFAAFCIISSIYHKFGLNENIDFIILNLALFIFYMLVFSYMDIKCIRYILPAIPAFIFFVIYALESILQVIGNGFDNKNGKNKYFVPKRLVSKLIPVVLIVICLIVVFNYTNTVEIADRGNEIVEVCDFIIDHDPDYQSKEIGSYIDRYIEWYLNKKINLVNDFPPENSNLTYIISQEKFDSPLYDEIYDSGSLYVYEKNIQ